MSTTLLGKAGSGNSLYGRHQEKSIITPAARERNGDRTPTNPLEPARAAEETLFPDPPCGRGLLTLVSEEGAWVFAPRRGVAETFRSNVFVTCSSSVYRGKFPLPRVRRMDLGLCIMKGPLLVSGAVVEPLGFESGFLIKGTKAPWAARAGSSGSIGVLHAFSPACCRRFYGFLLVPAV